jgi:hypothetical protein
LGIDRQSARLIDHKRFAPPKLRQIHCQSKGAADADISDCFSVE